MMKNILAILVLTFSIGSASAAYVNPTDAIVGQGSIVFSGAVYIDNDALGDGSFSESRGIANITAIRNAMGDLLWDDTDSELNLVFEGFTRSPLVDLGGGISSFYSTIGSVNFYENDTGAFVVSGDFDADSNSIETGYNVLLAEAQPDSVYNRAANGQFGESSYASNGQLSVISGAWYDMLNTNSILDSNLLAFADMTFNISADNTSNGGYDYSGSGDLATLSVGATQVSEPSSIGLLGLGLIGVGFIQRRRNIMGVL